MRDSYFFLCWYRQNFKNFVVGKCFYWKFKKNLSRNWAPIIWNATRKKYECLKTKDELFVFRKWTFTSSTRSVLRRQMKETTNSFLALFITYKSVGASFGNENPETRVLYHLLGMASSVNYPFIFYVSSNVLWYLYCSFSRGRCLQIQSLIAAADHLHAQWREITRSIVSYHEILSFKPSKTFPEHNRINDNSSYWLNRKAFSSSCSILFRERTWTMNSNDFVIFSDLSWLIKWIALHRLYTKIVVDLGSLIVIPNAFLRLLVKWSGIRLSPPLRFFRTGTDNECFELNSTWKLLNVNRRTIFWFLLVSSCSWTPGHPLQLPSIYPR